MIQVGKPTEWDLTSGNLLHNYGKWPIEIVDLPNKNGDFPVRYVSLPEGKHPTLASHGAMSLSCV